MAYLAAALSRPNAPIPLAQLDPPAVLDETTPQEAKDAGLEARDGMPLLAIERDELARFKTQIGELKVQEAEHRQSANESSADRCRAQWEALEDDILERTTPRQQSRLVYGTATRRQARVRMAIGRCCNKIGEDGGPGGEAAEHFRTYIEVSVTGLTYRPPRDICWRT